MRNTLDVGSGGRVETTLTALTRIADGVQTSPLDVALGIAQFLAVVLSLVALRIAFSALRGEQASRSTDALSRLFEHFDRSCYHVRMWRMDQATRTDGPAEIGEKQVLDLLKDPRPAVAKLARESLASDWSVDRADMFAVYFFAVRVNSWLDTSKDGTRVERIRLLNGTFGHQLFATFLNHRAVACRLRRPSQEAGYYPTHYGLFDPDYTAVFDALGDDLLAPGRLHSEVSDPMRAKLAALRKYMESLAPLAEVTDPPVDVAVEALESEQ